MKALSLIVDLLIGLGMAQKPCANSAIQEIIHTADLVAIVSAKEDGYGLFPDSIYWLNVHKVYKGRASYDFLITSPNYEFRRDTKYLILAEEYDDLKFRLRRSSNECITTTELASSPAELVAFLEERWISECYSKELEDEMKEKANTRELQHFCGCDGRTYDNYGHMVSNGITQYTPGMCEE